MPFVPRSHHGSHKQHRRQSQPLANTGEAAAAVAGGLAQVSPQLMARDASLDTASISIDHQADQLHFADHQFVFAMGMFIAVLIAYLSRRHIRASFSRIVHAISVHGPTITTASHLVHIHFHTTTTHSYSPLHDADNEHSPIERSATIDLEASASRHHHVQLQQRDRHLLREEEPAPPYSTATSAAPIARSVPAAAAVDKRNAKALHIKVPPHPSSSRLMRGDVQASAYPPPRSSSLTPSSSSTTSLGSGYRSPSVVSDSGSSCGSISPVVTPIELDAHKVNTSVLDLASPRASRWDAFSNVVNNGISSNRNNGFYRPALPSDILGTHSPSATPPPQYTITIHSAGQAVYNNGYQQDGGRESEVSVVPDIVLSPVPWLPRESVPKSPPHYLTVPPRKSRSRRSNTTPSEKKLPAAPSQDEKSWATKMHEKDVGGTEATKVKKTSGMVEKKRHYFTQPVSLMALPAITHSSVADNLFEIDSPVSMSGSPTVRGGSAVAFPRVSSPAPTPSSSGSGSLQRASTLPVPNASVARPRVAAPPPRPILPDDLEAVYPDTPSETDDDSSSTSSSSSTSTSTSNPISYDGGWGKTGFSEKNGDEYNTSSFSYGRRTGTERLPYAKVGSEAAYSEKRGWTMPLDEKTRDTNESEDEDDVPLAQELLRAVRKKKEQVMLSRRFSLNNANKDANPSTTSEKNKSPVIASKVFKEKLFGRLSALAARAKEALESELDSDDEEKKTRNNHGRDVEARRRVAEEYEKRREAMLQREREAANAFVIGEED